MLRIVNLITYLFLFHLQPIVLNLSVRVFSFKALTKILHIEQNLETTHFDTVKFTSVGTSLWL